MDFERSKTGGISSCHLEMSNKKRPPLQIESQTLGERPAVSVIFVDAVKNNLTRMSLVIEDGPISDECRALAQKDLRETEDNVKNGLETLKKLLKEDQTLYFRSDDEFLLIFLRPCKFYPESAFALMKRIAEFREKNNTILQNISLETDKKFLLETTVVNVLKNRDQKKRRILVVNAGKQWDPSKMNADHLFRLFYLIHLAAVLEPETQVYGTVVIMDFDGLSMKQVMGLTPSFSMRLLTFIQDAMPLRLKEVHFVKQPYLFNMVWTMFKPFVREKLRNRMYFHGSKMTSLHNHLSPTHLPKNYGGQLPEIDYTGADWYPVIQKYEDRIKEWNTFGYRKEA